MGKKYNWKLIVGILFVIGGVGLFGEDIGGAIFGIVAGAAFIFWWKRSKDKVKREVEKQIADELAKEYKFKVVGVTHANDDGTSRQDALEQVYNNGKIADVTFKSFTFQGDRALYVLSGGNCIGCVSADCVDDVAELINKGRVAKIFVDKFENESKETIYYASITF